MYVATDQHLLVPVGRRHRVVVQPIAHERERVDATRLLVASVVGSWQRLLEGGEIVLQPLADRAVMAAQSGREALPATLQKMRVQCLEVSEQTLWGQQRPRIWVSFRFVARTEGTPTCD